MSTESRGLPGPAARRRVAAAVRRFQRWKAGFIYKKIDSTLRGPVGPEADAFRKALKVSGVLPFVPAFPAAGRTVQGGRLRVDGVPLHKTPFGRDPRHPILTDRVADILGPALAEGVWIPEVPDQAALTRIAREALRRGSSAAVGSAGFGAALADLLRRGSPLPAGGVGRSQASVPAGEGTVMLLTGSAHPLSRAQAAAARDAQNLVAISVPVRRGNPAAVLRRVVRVAAREARRLAIRRFAVTGGETAAALARALGVRRWDLLEELDRGVPLLSSAGAGPRTWWVFKPGGFGREDVWKRAIKRLSAT